VIEGHFRAATINTFTYLGMPESVAGWPTVPAGIK
jgi:hypothetical protein